MSCTVTIAIVSLLSCLVNAFSIIAFNTSNVIVFCLRCRFYHVGFFVFHPMSIRVFLLYCR